MVIILLIILNYKSFNEYMKTTTKLQRQISAYIPKQSKIKLKPKPIQSKITSQTEQTKKFLKSISFDTENQEISFGQHTDKHEKLLQITSKCLNYYNKFENQCISQTQIMEKSFKQIEEKVNMAFKQIINQAMRKNQQISNFLEKQYKDLQLQKEIQKQTLKKHFNQIQANLSTIMGEKQKSFENYDEILKNYAFVLNNFFDVVSQIQSNSYQDNVDECISFINNLIHEQLRNIVEQKMPQKFEELISVSFGNNDLFDLNKPDHNQTNQDEESLFGSLSQKQLNQLPTQQQYILKELQQIKNHQRQRSQKLTQLMTSIPQCQDFSFSKLVQ